MTCWKVGAQCWTSCCRWLPAVYADALQLVMPSSFLAWSH
jgi:hypothetical protein